MKNMEGAGHRGIYVPKVSTCRVRLLLLAVNELFSFVFGSDPLFPQQPGKKRYRKGDMLRKNPESFILQSKYIYDVKVLQNLRSTVWRQRFLLFTVGQQ